ncbi:MAG: hypothetical protein ACTHN5_05390 [Phycisphaerae bacterium]
MRVDHQRISIRIALCLAAALAPAAFGEATTKPALPTYTIGQTVEVKQGASWEPAKIVNRDADVYWISYDRFKGNKFFYEWVTVDRIRKPGETRDTPGFAKPTPHGQKPDKATRLQALVNLGLAAPAPEKSAPKPEAKPATADGAEKKEALPAGTVAMDWSGVKELSPQEAGKKYLADAGDIGKWNANGVGLGPVQRGGTLQIKALLPTSVAAGKIGVQYDDWAHNVPTRIQMADLRTGQGNTVITLPAGEKPIALSPDGKRILLSMAADPQGRFGTVAEVGAINGTTVKSLAIFVPGEKYEDRPPRITWGAFVDEDHVLLQDVTGRVTLFSISDKKAVYTTKETHGDPALSANRKFAAIGMLNHVAVVDALTGETIAVVPGGIWVRGAAFRNDGERLAVYGWGRIRVFDLEKREEVADIILPPKVDAAQAEWVDADHLLMNRTYLVSVPKGLILWKYEKPEAQGADQVQEIVLGGRLWVACVRSNGAGPQARSARTLASATLPDAPAAAMEAKLHEEDVMALHPGVKVTLDVAVGNDEGNAAIAKHLQEELARNGMEVADGQKIRLEARMTPDKPHEMTYQGFGVSERMTVNDMKGTVSFRVDGKEAWSWSAIQPPPGFLQVKKGDSVQQVVAAEQAKAWRILSGVELPRRVPAPREEVGFGTSPLIPGTTKR